MVRLLHARAVRRTPHALLCRTRSIYANAKLANMLFTLELRKRLAKHAPGVLAVACHPGYTATGLQLTPGKGPEWMMRAMNAAFAQDVRMGAQPQLYAALGDDIENGDFTGPEGLSKGPAMKVSRSKRAQDEDAAAKFWALSAKLTGIDYLVD
jgi:NAD(P)-dependent dehydrogenase (short-subunit alcohol dehydrogenase family)